MINLVDDMPYSARYITMMIRNNIKNTSQEMELIGHILFYNLIQPGLALFKTGLKEKTNLAHVILSLTSRL